MRMTIHTDSIPSSTSPTQPAPAALDDPYYYLHNFHTALDWVSARYADLLSPEEQVFIARFTTLPQAARALLVRMIMRKGTLFRAGKLRYAEIDDIPAAMTTLCEQGWVTHDPVITPAELFAVLTRPELQQSFGKRLPAGRKADQLAALAADDPAPRPLSAWAPSLADTLYTLTIMPLCDRLRLMFFGNLHQDWSEFVLAELGVYRYETVPMDQHSRAFHDAADIDLGLRLHACREALDAGEPVADVLARLPQGDAGTDWLQARRERLLFRLGQQAEKDQDFDTALAIYPACRWPGARARHIRVLERCGHDRDALALARHAWQQPEDDAEQQQLARMMPRLQRRLGEPVERTARPAPPAEQLLILPRPDVPQPVEYVVRDHLHSDDAPVYYVENTLITGLFGLLCWKALFTPLPGAFFHPFHHAPADLLQPDFYPRRQALFDAALAELDDTRWRDTVRRHFHEKAGLQNPFVFWGALDATLLEQALACLPPEHLALWFRRLLQDIRAHRAGMPDLIRFYPGERRYDMIEVKGPGDRLQDNQLRWLAFCAEHRMPVSVCYLRWADDT